MQIPWLFPIFIFSLTFNKIPWLFPDFSLTFAKSGISLTFPWPLDTLEIYLPNQQFYLPWAIWQWTKWSPVPVDVCFIRCPPTLWSVWPHCLQAPSCPPCLSTWQHVPASSVNSSPPGQNGRHFADYILDAFSWMKSFEFWLKFHLSLFLRVQLTITQHWFR